MGFLVQAVLHSDVVGQATNNGESLMTLSQRGFIKTSCIAWVIVGQATNNGEMPNTNDNMFFIHVGAGVKEINYSFRPGKIEVS
ncbi:MAG: hypothetical protein LH478_11605 [Chitinophagaceae bacterium]|nr:hypothetical protein [Chitinophagaceae bacterium]